MRKLIWGLFAVAVQVGIASAQQLPSQSPSTSTSFDGYPSPEEIQASIDELAKQTIPDKDALLLRELDRVDGEIARASQQAQKANSWKNTQQFYTRISDQVTAQAKAVADIDCQNNPAKISVVHTSYVRAWGELYRFASTLASVDFYSIAYTPPAGGITPDVCTDAKSKFSSPEFKDTLSKVLDQVQKALTDFLTEQATLATAETKYLDALRKRRIAVQDKLNASQPAVQIGSNLQYLLGVLGLACVATILGIRMFSAEIQMEWVASGQVIQFVTVMILLSVVLALGLSTQLHENTLGTLLGGIAGYVLAQGVGRSAARAAATAQRPPAAAAPASVAPAPAAVASKDAAV